MVRTGCSAFTKLNVYQTLHSVVFVCLFMPSFWFLIDRGWVFISFSAAAALVKQLKIVLAFPFTSLNLKTLLRTVMWQPVAWKVPYLRRDKVSDLPGRGDVEPQQTSDPEAYLTVNYLQAKRINFQKVMANIFSCLLKSTVPSRALGTLSEPLQIYISPNQHRFL